MPTRRIKESFGPPAIPAGTPPQERQRILQAHREHRDMVRQLNEVRAEQDDELAALNDVFQVARPIAAGRVSTDGAGGFTTNQTRGCVVSIAAPALRITFNTPASARLSYQVTGIYLSALNFRIPMITAYNQEFVDITAKNDANASISAATNPLTFSFTIFDWDD